MAKGSEALSFEKLKLESMVIEMRYSFAYLFWDRAGQVFDQIQQKLPAGKVNLQSAQPGKVEIVYDGRYEITVETERFYIAVGGPGLETKKFFEVATVVYDTVIEMLGVEKFARVGFRQIFVKKFPSLKKA